jgi:hypothetical protein
LDRRYTRGAYCDQRLTKNETNFAGVVVQPTLAKGHKTNPGYTLVGQTALENTKATDLFLRQDDQGRKYLYVVYANDTLAVLNVTNGAEIAETHHLTLAANAQTQHVEPVNDRFALVTNTPDSQGDLALMDTKTPATPEIAKEFRNSDCYDPSDNTLYVVHDGELSVLRFDRPISRDAQLFEESFENR